MKSNPFPYIAWLTIASATLTFGGDPTPDLTQDSASWATVILNGSADLDGDKLRLTPAAVWRVGSAWLESKQVVQGGFTTTFQFQITELGKRCAAEAGADGFAFVIQNSSEHAVGDAGGGIGYGTDPARSGGDLGIPNSLAIEFDTYDNSGQGNTDPGNNHVSIQTRSVAANSVGHTASLGETVKIPNLKDGNLRIARITYGCGALRVFIDDLTTPVLTVALRDLGLTLDNGRAWVGFTAATGEAWANHDILNWSFAESPRCTNRCK